MRITGGAIVRLVLADLVAARRPTVTSALSDLSRRGLVRGVDEGWLLSGDSPKDPHQGIQARKACLVPDSWTPLDLPERANLFSFVQARG